MPAILILCFIVSLVWLKWPLLAYLLIFVALIVTEWWLAYPGRVIDRPQQPKPRSALNTMIGVGLGSLLVVFAPLGVWVVMDPLKAGRWLGGLGVLFVAVMLFANLTVLYRRGHERLATGRSSKWMPRVLTGIALLVGYLAVSGAYNEAPVRRHVKPATDPAPRQTAAQYIDRWLAERVSVDQKSGERVPVFIVAAEGGGIRAGYWTAGVLAGIHDRFPQFSDHTLALSGVSGGNVGVGTYAALLKAKQAWGAGSSPSCYGKNKLQACASEVLGADLLAAPLGAMLLGDVWRSMTSLTAFRASGSSIPDPPKRSPLLEQSLEQAFADATGQHTLSEPWQSLWTDTPARIPFVISNLTHVNTTSRVVVTPFKPGKTWKGAIDLSESLDARSIAGSTVILLSARFPGISTTAVHGDNRLVDGGYSDNSGIAAALETINELMRVAQKCGVADRIAPTLIVIKNGRDTLAPPGSSSLLGQLFGAIVRPLLAPNGMFGVFTDPVRTAAGGLDAFTRIYRDLALDNPHLQHPNAIIEIALPWDETDRLPLGWAMSKMTVKAMDDKLNRTLDGPVVKRIVALMSGRP